MGINARPGAVRRREGEPSRVRRRHRDPGATHGPGRESAGCDAGFHRQWLELDRLDREGTKDATAYPSFSPALKVAMREESDRFIGDVMTKGDGSLKSLLTSTSTFVNADLAKLYGVAAPASHGGCDAGSGERAGFLTHRTCQPRSLAIGLSASARGLHHASPDVRDAAASPADAEYSAAQSRSQRRGPDQPAAFEARTVGACLGCHGTINPIGFGLENYDAIGAYRTTDNGLPVDAKGQLSSIDVAGPFSGGVELSQRLADSADVRRCMTGQWYEYALGRDRQLSDECKIDALDKSLAAAGGNIREMLVALTKTDDFMFRRAP